MKLGISFPPAEGCYVVLSPQVTEHLRVSSLSMGSMPPTPSIPFHSQRPHYDSWEVLLQHWREGSRGQSYSYPFMHATASSSKSGFPVKSFSPAPHPRYKANYLCVTASRHCAVFSDVRAGQKMLFIFPQKIVSFW
ncbi:unnamed protein product [Eretmochelys imbricata]